jgi:hypothetical protein
MDKLSVILGQIQTALDVLTAARKLAPWISASLDDDGEHKPGEEYRKDAETFLEAIQDLEETY